VVPLRTAAGAALALAAGATCACGGSVAGRATGAGSPAAPTVSSVRAAATGRAPERSWPTAMLLRPTAMRTRPGGPVMARLGTRTPFGSPVVLAVVRRRGRWLGVLHPRAGNGRVGWIAAAGTRAYRTSWSIVVSLRRRSATVSRGGRALWRFPVAVGTPATPTPAGRFAVTDRVLFRPAGAYGCCALALTARQPHIAQGWGGGDRIAFHATLATSTIGTAASHGCLRTDTRDIRRLVRAIPLGSPVTIG